MLKWKSPGFLGGRCSHEQGRGPPRPALRKFPEHNRTVLPNPETNPVPWPGLLGRSKEQTSLQVCCLSVVHMCAHTCTCVSKSSPHIDTHQGTSSCAPRRPQTASREGPRWESCFGRGCWWEAKSASLMPVELPRKPCCGEVRVLSRFPANQPPRRRRWPDITSYQLLTELSCKDFWALVAPTFCWSLCFFKQKPLVPDRGGSPSSGNTVLFEGREANVRIRLPVHGS